MLALFHMLIFSNHLFWTYLAILLLNLSRHEIMVCLKNDCFLSDIILHNFKECMTWKMSSPGNPWCLQLQVSAAVQLDICKVLLQVHQNFFFFFFKVLQNGIQMRLFSITSPYVPVRIITYLLNRVQQLLGSHSSLSGKSVISTQLIWSVVLSLYWYRHMH